MLEKELGEPGPERIWYVGDAFGMGLSVDEVYDLTKIDKWFLVQIEEIVKIELDLDKLVERRARSGRAGRRQRCARSSARASPTAASPSC